VAASAELSAQEIPRERIEDAIREGCERIMQTQRDDGALILDERRMGPEGYYVYPVGTVSLGVLALQHAVPHLRGETATRARESIRKGLAWLAQHPLDPKTYSAGLIISVLHKQDPKKYHKLIGLYAAMLVLSQQPDGRDVGSYGYDLHLPPGYRLRENEETERRTTLGQADHSNAQFAVLGLLFAQRSGYQIPKRTWRMLRKHYIDVQNADGGWGYRPGRSRSDSYANMTLASTISLAIAEEMLFAGEHKECKPPPESRPVDKGLRWVGDNLDYRRLETYGFYAVERLGILSGYSDFGGKPWLESGTSLLVANRSWPAHGEGGRNQQVGAAFAVLFLSRGLEPVIINKLKRRGTNDWNNHLHDIRHLVEYISEKFQREKQWRIVTLDVPVDYLLKVPILWISGHEKLDFNAEEKAKLKEYVERGGTILGEACCSRKTFDGSFRELMKELWPDSELRTVPKTHEIYNMPRRLRNYTVPVMQLWNTVNNTSIGVLYLPRGISCEWERGGTKARLPFDLGTNIFFYVDKIASKRVPQPAAVTVPEDGQPGGGEGAAP